MLIVLTNKQLRETADGLLVGGGVRLLLASLDAAN